MAVTDTPKMHALGRQLRALLRGEGVDSVTGFGRCRKLWCGKCYTSVANPEFLPRPDVVWLDGPNDQKTQLGFEALVMATISSYPSNATNVYLGNCISPGQRLTQRMMYLPWHASKRLIWTRSGAVRGPPSTQTLVKLGRCSSAGTFV